MNKLDPRALSDAVKYIDSWLKLNFDDSRLVGMQVAIQRDDELLYSKAFGYADLQNKTALTTSHTFRVASHSKTFTAVAILRLVESGRLNLDDPISTHLPWFKSSADPRVERVTIRQTLNHTAGLIRDGLNADYWQAMGDYPRESDLKSYITYAKLIYPSDKRFKYSNFGFGYLGLLIESITAKSYADYMRQAIIEPLGLESTGADLDDKATATLATGYGHELFGRPRKPFGHIKTNALAGATGFYSTAEELCRYFTNYLPGSTTLMNEGSKKSMQNARWESEKGQEHYGLGLVAYDRKPTRLYGHGGGFPGFLTSTKFDPANRIVVSVLCNSFGALTGAINTTIFNLLGSFSEAPYDEKPELDKYTGRFYSKWGATDIVNVNGKLLTARPHYWSDFSEVDTLKVVDGSTLAIEDASGYESPGELVKYSFSKNGEILSVNYAGTSLLNWEEAVNTGWF